MMHSQGEQSVIELSMQEYHADRRIQVCDADQQLFKVRSDLRFSDMYLLHIERRDFGPSTCNTIWTWPTTLLVQLNTALFSVHKNLLSFIMARIQQMS